VTDYLSDNSVGDTCGSCEALAFATNYSCLCETSTKHNGRSLFVMTSILENGSGTCLGAAQRSEINQLSLCVVQVMQLGEHVGKWLGAEPSSVTRSHHRQERFVREAMKAGL
jgi:hypothetical protein